MQRRFRLTRSDDFVRVRRNGKSYTHPLVVLTVQAGSSPHTRVGVAAGKMIGSAVQRNRAKRLLREAIRSLMPSLPPGWDLILISRAGLASASFEETRAALASLLRRAGLFSTDGS